MKAKATATAPSSTSTRAAPKATASSRGFALGLVAIVVLLIVPMPTFLLDVLLAVSICVSLLIFLLAIHYGDPVDFSTFPSVLLVVTMLRLALNVASTRLILIRGHEGTDAAGSVIQSFGAFVVGGNYVVGIVIFLILVIINFKVITAGAGRIAEVAARFTLDAMPGKQMAIDNDLANGHITEAEARKRRQTITDEADFYGAMDGANKFVKGDAVAGLIITGINVVGGMIIGIAQQHLSLRDAAETYTILTVGDGLASQIPALLVSTAAGLIATRTASGESLGDTLSTQLFDRAEPLQLAAVALTILALVPGMPTLPFVALAAGTYGLSRRAGRRDTSSAPAGTSDTKAETADAEPTLHEILAIDLLALEVGFDLVALVDRQRGGELIKRITGIRRQLAQDLGVVVPPIHVRDNLTLPSSTYSLLLSGTSIARGELRPGRLLAINPGGASGSLPGEKTTDPAFHLPAVWIGAGDRDRAEILGYTVVDAATVAATHITEQLKAHAADLLGRAEAQELIHNFSISNPKLVEEVIPTLLPLGEVIKVLKHLLSEGVAIRDLRTILEAIADHAAHTKDPEQLTEQVRQRLGRSLCSAFISADGLIRALVLDPTVEHWLRGRHGGPEGGPDPAILPRFVKGVEAAVMGLSGQTTPPVLLVSADLRRTVASIVSRHAPGLAVLSYREIDPRTNVKTTGVVKLTP